MVQGKATENRFFLLCIDSYKPRFCQLYAICSLQKVGKERKSLTFLKLLERVIGKVLLSLFCKDS